MLLKEVKGMLLSFRVKNYRSFANEAGIDFRASAIKEHSDTLIMHGSVPVLPVISIYGANASGKSNLFKALKAMQNRISGIISNNPATDEIIAHYIVPYMFDNQLLSQPTSFEVEVGDGKDEYRYGFECTKTQVLSEWLFAKHMGKNKPLKEKCIFYREGSQLETPEVVDKEKILYCFSQTKINNLLLTELYRSSVAPFDEIYEHIITNVTILDCSGDAQEKFLLSYFGKYFENNSQNNFMKADVELLLKTADPAIKGIVANKSKDSEMNDTYEIFTKHENSEGEIVQVKFEIESCGTQKLLSIIFWIFLSLGIGAALFIDELDIKLHPLLLRHIVKMFTDKNTNPHNAQLVFSSHNLICLDSSDLRRDEIWFVEKTEQKSEIYSLSDIKSNNTSIRSDLDFGKHYLAGRFGAIPFQDDGGD